MEQVTRKQHQHRPQGRTTPGRRDGTHGSPAPPERKHLVGIPQQPHIHPGSRRTTSNRKVATSAASRHDPSSTSLHPSPPSCTGSHFYPRMTTSAASRHTHTPAWGRFATGCTALSHTGTRHDPHTRYAIRTRVTALGPLHRHTHARVPMPDTQFARMRTHT